MALEVRPEPKEAEVKAPRASAAPLLQGPKRQHFLPKFYLEGFANNDGCVAVYDREKKEVRVQQPINTGVIGHFYTFTDELGRQRFELEQMLSEFEGKASLVIPKLVAKVGITDDERSNLAIFVALAGFRTPDIVDSIKQVSSDISRRFAKMQFANTSRAMEVMRGKPGSPTSEDELRKEAQDLVDFVKSEQYTLETDHSWAVNMGIRQALAIAPVLAGRDWVVLHRDNDIKSFVTSDAPVILTTVAPRDQSGFWGGIGFANSDALVMFPLCGSTALLIHGDTGTLTNRCVGTDQIRAFNLSIAERCQRFVIGRDSALVGSLSQRLGLDNKQWAPKMQPN